MKRCPECRRDYFDDSLRYCLDDGRVLLEGPGAAVEGDTIMLPRAGPSSGNVASRSSRSPAEDLYFQGRFYSGRDNQVDNAKAIERLEKAVEVDPDHALSHIELARAYGAKVFYFDSGNKDLLAKAYAILQRGFKIGTHLAEAHEVEGFLLWSPANGFPHEQAIDAYRAALALDPNLVDAHHWLGAAYFHIGLFDEAEMEIRTTLRLDPGKNLARLHSAMVDAYAGRYQKAIQALKALPRDLNPPLVAGITAWCLFTLGRVDVAADLIERSIIEFPADVGGQFAGLRSMILAKRGGSSEVEATIAEAIDNGSGFGHFHHTTHYIAAAYALMGRSQEALEYLHLTADGGFPCYPLFENDPSLDPIRPVPGFRDLMSDLEAVWKDRLDRYGISRADDDPTAQFRVQL